MRSYGNVYTGFWTSNDMGRHNATTKLIALYMLTGPHTTMLGAFRLPIPYICADLDLDTEAVNEAIKALSTTVPKPFRKGSETVSKGGEKAEHHDETPFCTYDKELKWVFINKFLKYNTPNNPNMVSAMEKVFSEVPHDVSFYSELREILSAISEPFRNGSETVPKRFRKGSETVSKSGTGTGTGTGIKTSPQSPPEGEGERSFDFPFPQEKKQVSRGDKKQKTDFSSEFEEFWRSFPPRAGSNSKPAAYTEWSARLEEGFTLEEIMAGTGRYAEYLRVEGKIGSRFVMSAKSFLTDDDPPPFKLHWDSDMQKKAMGEEADEPDWKAFSDPNDTPEKKKARIDAGYLKNYLAGTISADVLTHRGIPVPELH